MIKRILIFLSVTMLFGACYQFDQPKKPKNLISKEQMVNILLDMRLLASANGSNMAILVNNNIDSETYIYNKYKIDSVQFESSNNYYAYFVKDYEEIYTKVKDSLDALKVTFKELEELELIKKKEQDSLNLLKPKDSLRSIIINDSLPADIIRKKLSEKGKLIAPVSEKNPQ